MPLPFEVCGPTHSLVATSLQQGGPTKVSD